MNSKRKKRKQSAKGASNEAYLHLSVTLADKVLADISFVKYLAKGVKYITHPCKPFLHSGLTQKSDSLYYDGGTSPQHIRFHPPILHQSNTKKLLLAWMRSWKGCLIFFIVYVNTQYWMGQAHVPLICNLFSVECPKFQESFSGFVKPGYEKVEQAFQQNFLDGWELGASFSAYGKK